MYPKATCKTKGDITAVWVTPPSGLQITRALSAYVRAGLLLHGITLLELVILFFFTNGATEIGEDSIGDAAFHMAIYAFLVSLTILSQLDARSRFQSYKRVKDSFYMYGFDTRILKPFLKSRCQRDAAVAAAAELGYKDMCRDYYHSQGYRWYHILPDFVFTNPGYLSTRHFWQSTFFSKTYHAKIYFHEKRAEKESGLPLTHFD